MSINKKGGCLMAGILTRATDILKSNINAMLDKAEDPAKMIDQLLRDAKTNLAQVKRESAEVIAQETAAHRALVKEREDVAKVTMAAKAALNAGNEEDALKLAEQIAKEEVEVAQAEKVYAICYKNAENMRAVYRKLTADIQALEAKRANLKALLAASKAQETVNKTLSSTSGGIGTKINDFEDKIQRRFDAAQASASLDAEIGGEASNLVDKYTSSGEARDIIARLKGEMGITTPNATPAPPDAEDILARLRDNE